MCNKAHVEAGVDNVADKKCLSKSNESGSFSFYAVSCSSRSLLDTLFLVYAVGIVQK